MDVTVLTFFPSDFAVKMVKQGNFFNVIDIDLSFDERFAKYWPMNNIKVKCSQFNESVSGIFWTCPSQIVPDNGKQITST